MNNRINDDVYEIVESTSNKQREKAQLRKPLTAIIREGTNIMYVSRHVVEIAETRRLECKQTYPETRLTFNSGIFLIIFFTQGIRGSSRDYRA